MNYENNIKVRMARPRIGLLATGHLIYWDQFPNLKEMGMQMYNELITHLEKIGDVVSPGHQELKVSTCKTISS
jgi:hypothetical protein